MRIRILGLGFLTLSTLALSFAWGQVNQTDSKKADDPALLRTRKQVQMLDDIYKGGVVLITTNYVNEDTDMPAGVAFKALFAAAKAKGWHEVRLLDATGDPYNPENAPEDDFEKAAIKALTVGKEAWYEREITKDGKRFLRVATAVPVVMEKCIMCHSNYEGLEKGVAIGALGYTIPIE